MRIQTKEEAGSSATTSSSSFLTANDYSWMIKAMDQLSVARQVGTGMAQGPRMGSAALGCQTLTGGLA